MLAGPGRRRDALYVVSVDSDDVTVGSGLLVYGAESVRADVVADLSDITIASLVAHVAATRGLRPEDLVLIWFSPPSAGPGGPTRNRSRPP